MKECSRCGRCCESAQCTFGAIANGMAGKRIMERCPSLRRMPDGKYACGVYLDSDEFYRRQIARFLKFGEGCHFVLPMMKAENP